MLLHRILTALVAVPILVLYIWKGGSLLFFVLICAVSCISINEFFRIVFNNKTYPPVSSKIPLFTCLTAILVTLGAYLQSPVFILCVLIINFLIAGSLVIFNYEPEENILDVLFKQIQCVIYIPLLLSSLVFVRNSENGLTWIFFILLLVAAGDTGAYFAGTYLGKKKLCPQVSPGKTVEGFIGAMIAVFCFGMYFKVSLLPELNWFLAAMTLPIIAITGVVGDLFESVLKREGKIKDSGTILPGHGGMLDRIDGLIFVAPVVFFVKYIFVN